MLRTYGLSLDEDGQPDAPDRGLSAIDRLRAAQAQDREIPQMLCTTAHYREESGNIRAALARMHTTHREGRQGA